MKKRSGHLVYASVAQAYSTDVQPFALKGANAQSGNLSTRYDGKLPNGYNPMKKQGAIVLGSGGDCCATNRNLSLGTFYEGAIVSGYPTDAIDDSIQGSIVSAGYGS